MRFYLVLIFVAFQMLSFAQTSDKYSSKYAAFYRAEKLFEKHQFGAARIQFRTFISDLQNPHDPLYEKAMYYEALAALELFNNDAVKLMEDFNRNYPESIYKNGIYFRLGQYYYQNKKYKDAIEWFKKLKKADLEKDELSEYYFKLGHSNFQSGLYKDARNAFYEIKEDSSQYGAPALYYFSHINYQDKSYQVALDGFMQLKDNPQFSKLTPYYILQIYHAQGRYQEVIDYAPNLVDSLDLANIKDINHIIGDAYYQLNQFEKAVPYLKAYNDKTHTTRKEDYELGYAYYKSGQFDQAVKIFDNLLHNISDTICQLSYYHIGKSYLERGNLSAARRAFQGASKIDMDAVVKEDALYRYAILSYQLDMNPFDESIEAFQFYLLHYPNSKRKEDVTQYLVDVYTKTNNYEKALASLDKIPNKTTKLKVAYQIVAYNRGVELYQKVKYFDAINSFKLVEKYPIDASIIGKAKFWSSDAYYHLKDFPTAIKGYREYINLPAIANPEMKAEAYYNIGYGYYENHDTLLGIEAFRIFTQQLHIGNQKKLADACMRIADGCYSTRQNELAIRYYKQVLEINKGYEDQALFYIAKTYGFNDNIESKITFLQRLVNDYPTSKYALSSIEELAGTFKSQEQYDKAKQYFDIIITDYPTSSLVRMARIENADILFKQQKFDESEIAYLKILSEFGGEDREICEVAAKGLIGIYKAQVLPEKAVQVGEKYACAGLTKGQQEEIFYAPAKVSYNDTLKPLAETIALFNKYLDKYPNGLYASECKNYIADCYYRMNSMPEAITIYRELLEGPNNRFTEEAAIRVSKYLYNNDQRDEAIPYYLRLEQISSSPNVIYNSRLNLMRSYFITEHWAEAANYANIVLNESQLSSALKLEAEYASGYSYYQLSEFDKARPSLEWLVNNTTTATGAEAKFMLASMLYEEQKYDAANAEVQALIRMKPSYNYWVARGLLLHSNIQIGLEDLFQAEETLNSIIEHYPNATDGIIDEAKIALESLKQQKNVEKEIEADTIPVIELNENEVIDEE